MNSSTFIAIVAFVLLIIGTSVALLWWKLVRGVAPYKDEVGEGPTRARDDSEVVIITPTSAPAPRDKD